KVAMFSTKRYDKRFFERHNNDYNHDIKYFEARLNSDTVTLAKGFPVVCAFVNDTLDAQTLTTLKENGTGLIALRSAGFNNVDIDKAEELGMRVMRVPAYSPHAVAEHALGLMLVLNRKIHKAQDRVRDQNFSLKGLVGFDMHGKTAGVIGVGKIGSVMCELLLGLGCRVIAYAHHEREQLKEKGVAFVSQEELLSQSDIITLHVPLTPETHHMINAESIAKMKDGVMLINTCRGKVVDTSAVLDGLKSGKVGYFGLDVYEEEGDIFYRDLSEQVMTDEMIAQLILMPNAVITAHQGYLTREALESIAETTLKNIADFEAGKSSDNEVHPEKHKKR
ncbi:MAG: 2-hydroxyacid dehydrogenase, partial [Desulfovibrionales bacterium]